MTLNQIKQTKSLEIKRWSHVQQPQLFIFFLYMDMTKKLAKEDYLF